MIMKQKLFSHAWRELNLKHDTILSGMGSTFGTRYRVFGVTNVIELVNAELVRPLLENCVVPLSGFDDILGQRFG